MNTAVITTKIDLPTKKQAMKTAVRLGMPLSVIIKAFLKHFIRTETFIVSTRNDVSGEYLRSIIRLAKEDMKVKRAHTVHS